MTSNIHLYKELQKQVVGLFIEEKNIAVTF